MERLNSRLTCMSDALGDKEWLEGRFTIADLMLVTVLRQLRGGRTVDRFPNLAALVARGEARPAFQSALADQLAVFAENQPEPQPA
jgi:glutathione S-transferase